MARGLAPGCRSRLASPLLDLLVDRLAAGRRLRGCAIRRASRHRREHRDLVGVADGSVELAGLAVAPDRAVLEEVAERRRRSAPRRRRARRRRWRPARSSRPVPAASRAPAKSRSTANRHLLRVRQCGRERSDGAFRATQPAGAERRRPPGRFARHDPRAAHPPRAVRVERRRAVAGPGGPTAHRPRAPPGAARGPQPRHRRRDRRVGPAAGERDGDDHQRGARRRPGGARAGAPRARRRRVVGAHPRRDRARLARLPRLGRRPIGTPAFGSAPASTVGSPGGATATAELGARRGAPRAGDRRRSAACTTSRPTAR